MPVIDFLEDSLCQKDPERRNMEKPLVQGFVQKYFSHHRTTLPGLHLFRSQCAQRHLATGKDSEGAA